VIREHVRQLACVIEFAEVFCKRDYRAREEPHVCCATIRQLYNDFYYCRDNVPVIELASWSLDCDLFEGETMGGPVPVLFSEDVEATRQALESNAGRAHSRVS
jgi:hypothetical protein